MSKLHISISELDEKGLTYEEFFRVIVILLNHEIFYLRELHSSKSINDLEAYPLQIVQRIVKTAFTLHSVIERDNDYVVANIIVRSIADGLSSFALIYRDEGEQKLLRHYLYIIDGLQGRLKQLPDQLTNNGRLSQAEFDGLLVQINKAIANYKRASDFSVCQIHRLSIYNSYKATIDKLVFNANWKYKCLNSLDMKKNKYNWNELYTFLGLKNVSGFFSSLSEFVHGLSTSNFAVDENIETFEPIYGIATSLLGKLSEFLNIMYANDMNTVRPKLISALCDRGMPMHYVDSLLKTYANKGVPISDYE